jgi:hypothetical protein
MAGAVPVEYVGPGEKYWDGASLPAACRPLLPRGPVIGLAAPLGYTAAGERFFPPCIGYAGPRPVSRGRERNPRGGARRLYWGGKSPGNAWPGCSIGAVTWRIQERSVAANELPLPGETEANELPVRDV